MKLLGLRNVNLHQAVLPDLTGLPANRGVKDPLHEPVFRELNGRLHLACGRQLVADHIRSKNMVITGRVVECDDGEMARMTLYDEVWDAARRKDLFAQYRHMTAVVEAFMPDAAYGPLPAGARGAKGAPVTVKGRAQRMAAAALGVELRTIRRAAAWSKGKPDRTRPAKWTKPFKTFGLLEPGCDTQRLLTRLQKAMHEADSHIRSAESAVSRVVSDPNVACLARGVALSRIYDNLSLIGQRAREEIPSSLCPACKGVEGLCETCVYCNAKGWVGDEGLKRWEQAPQLLDESDVHVLVDGQIRRLSEL